MNVIDDTMDKVGIIKRKEPRRSGRTAPNTASATATATLAAILGASTPAAAHRGKGREFVVSVKVVGLNLADWSCTPHSTPALTVAPAKIDRVEAPVAHALSEALAFAELVNTVMPVDEEMDRRAESALMRHIASQPSRKLRRK